MDTFLKAAAAAIVVCLLCLTTSKHNKEFSLLLTIACSCLIGAVAISYCQPVFAFIKKLTTLGQLNIDLLRILTKAVGIALICEFVVLICNDSSNAAIGKALQFMATAVILWLSIPLFENLIDLISDVLNSV